MKSYFIVIIAAMFLTLTACEKTDETIDRIDDAFDLEPYDKIRGAAGDVREEIKDLATED